MNIKAWFHRRSEKKRLAKEVAERRADEARKVQRQELVIKWKKFKDSLIEAGIRPISWGNEPRSGEPSFTGWAVAPDNSIIQFAISHTGGVILKKL